jgi:NAD(P)-dependent dehydrogenase (short-subunit alcohol dehydrogenase family)
VRLLSKSVALAGARNKPPVRCNSVHPTFIEGPMTGAMLATVPNPDETRAKMERSIPLGRFGQPSEVAEMCVYLLSDESAFVTGAEFAIDGGLTAQ